MMNYAMLSTPSPTKASTTIELHLPEWLPGILAEYRQPLVDTASRMQLAIRLARLNIEHGSGGPFGAAIFDMENHRLVAAGVNLVLSSHCSMAHAEMVAISMAQQKLGTFDLGAFDPDTGSSSRFELVSSCEPCAMCFGALPWSGIRHLICAARDEDARAIGFDEGPKLADWIGTLNSRGISVETDLCRDEARSVLNDYAKNEGTIYNAQRV